MNRKLTLVPAHIAALSGQATYEPRLVCDWHETLVQFLGPIYNFAETLFGRKIVNRDKQLLYHPGYDPAIALTPAEWSETLRQFAAAAQGGYGSLPPYPLAGEQLKAIAKKLRLEIMTWCPGPADISDDHSIAFTDGTAQGVTRALIEKFVAAEGWPIAPKEVKVVHPSQKEREMRNRQLLLIAEDCPQTIVQAAHAGRLVFSIQRPYNTSTAGPGIIPVRGDLADFAEKVLAVTEELTQLGLLF